MATVAGDLNRFYHLLGCLKTLPGQGRRLTDYDGRFKWPTHGVYFFQEPGEYRLEQPDTPRVVRVGTHAVSATSKSTLWSRLRAHRGSRNGGGNHRGSIFRLHVGAAMLYQDTDEVAELSSWGVGSSAPKTVRNGELEHERRVSEWIGQMNLLWIEVPDAPGPRSMRAFIERNAIALLSNRLSPLDSPSQDWLGRNSPRVEIRSSGLWNLEHSQKGYDPGFLNELELLVNNSVAKFNLVKS